jgi:putative membrane protein
MRLLVIAATTVALCGTAASAQESAHMQAGSPNPATPATAPAPPNDTPGYLSQAGRGDLFEIEASQMELSRGHEPKAKAFADQMIHDHTQSTQMLLAAARQAGVPAAPPTTLDPRHQAMLDTLKAAPTPDFDRIYLQQQMQAHQEAAALHRNYAQNGDTAALRPVAGQIAQVVDHHIRMLADLGAR